MADRVYVPGYGYVTKGEPGTGSAPPKQAKTTASATDPHAALGVPKSERFNNEQRVSVSTATGVARPTGRVPYPMSGYGPLGTTGFGQRGGYEYGQRMGSSPDAGEAFPYGVAYRETTDAVNAFYELDPGYQGFLKALARNPAIGTGASTGRALWERLVRMSAEQNELGMPNRSPQMLAAELAFNLGVSPSEGRDGSSQPPGGGGSYGGGGYGGGGGGGGSVSLTNPTSARGLLMQTMQSVLGRNPTNDEYKTFLQVLNEAEMANPNTASFEGGMAVGSGGVDPGVLALEFAQDQEDFQERQGDNYFRTFMQALAGGV